MLRIFRDDVRARIFSDDVRTRIFQDDKVLSFLHTSYTRWSACLINSSLLNSLRLTILFTALLASLGL